MRHAILALLCLSSLPAHSAVAGERGQLAKLIADYEDQREAFLSLIERNELARTNHNQPTLEPIFTLLQEVRPTCSESYPLYIATFKKKTDPTIARLRTALFQSCHALEEVLSMELALANLEDAYLLELHRHYLAAWRIADAHLSSLRQPARP